MLHKKRVAQYSRRHGPKAILAALCVFAFAQMAHAAQIDITPASGVVAFGSSVTVLPNGNIVVTDPNGPTANIGAVYLYSPTGTRISVLTGSSTDDFVGSDGIVVVGPGNFVVVSQHWNNGTATGAGAVTWVNGSTGLSGVVSASNSLVGTTTDDFFGARGAKVLPNGNYEVRSPFWNNAAALSAGAVTWASGTTGISGAVSSTNSLVGGTQDDSVGYAPLAVLTNGNYVVGSPYWSNSGASEAGAATWADGSTGLRGVVSAANSLVGITANDIVGGSITALGNGNYVVASPDWNNGATSSVGAVTWGNGATGLSGPVSTSNSLTGVSPNDYVGFPGVTALSNGNYVVASLKWNALGATRVGAATWDDGRDAAVGTVYAANSLIGSNSNDTVGNGGVAALSNGNYVVMSPQWNNGVVSGAGAATWGNGTSGTVGTITPSNSLVGAAANDSVGNHVIALSNGNYVAANYYWHNGPTAFGASTWGDGTTGVSGPVSALNSLVGGSGNDNVAANLIGRSNGNYVVSSPQWSGLVGTDVGAATWANGSVGATGTVVAGNSLTGTNANDAVSSDGMLAVGNGNYIVVSASGSNVPLSLVGAVTWVRGNAGTAASVSAGNSLIGAYANDHVGLGSLTALSDGNYVVGSSGWTDGITANRGAVTLAKRPLPPEGHRPAVEQRDRNRSRRWTADELRLRRHAPRTGGRPPIRQHRQPVHDGPGVCG